MRIDSGNLLLSSQHGLMEKHSRAESLRVWAGPPGLERRNAAPPPPPPPPPAPDRVVLSGAGKAAATDKGTNVANDPVKGDAGLQLLIALVEHLTGRKVKVFSADELTAGSSALPEVRDPNQAEPAPATTGFGLEYDLHESHYEAEQTRFTAEGVVKTADGKDIRFTLQLDMSREFSLQTDIGARLGDAARRSKDPLVINFDGGAVQLGDQKFGFDLDLDGAKENISFVEPGSGFLALDRNRDGKVNDGAELFGPTTGDGFSELAAYDLDHNGWIDENDAVFRDLRVWIRDANGKDSLASLKDLNVGAIALATAATEFSVRSPRNEQLGQVRSTGIYLGETGSVGTVQHVDLAV